MTLCLYHPEFGYYRSGASRVGRDGDFYTSAYVGDAMGEQLASWLLKLSAELFPGDECVEVVDWGGGTGRLSLHMLEAWKDKSADQFALTLVDGNPAHRAEATERLAAYVQSGKARLLSSEEAERLEFGDRPVIIVANELLDAFPVYRLVRLDGQLREWGVAWEPATARFVPCLLETINPALLNYMDSENIELANDQTIEVNLEAAEWISKLAARMNRVLFVIIDYGDRSEELHAPHRMDGTLLCYSRHRVRNDPYSLPGEQDLTAHVNFTHMKSSAEAAGCEEIWYGNQKQFLVESGIMDKLASHSLTDPFHPLVRRNRAIRQLLLSDGMSELFKVQVLSKGV
jgi:SAM-dependent MidA family methyltransferase